MCEIWDVLEPCGEEDSGRTEHCRMVNGKSISQNKDLKS
jgi:hypothetical protein